MLVLITPTGNRPLAWELCQKYMAAQTYEGPVRWIVVDDGERASGPQHCYHAFPDEWEVYCIPQKPAEGNTQARNLLKAMERVGPDDRVLVIEDDDYYAPNYLHEMNARLDVADLVGITESRYFNVATGKGRVMSNRTHASLYCTGMKGPALDVFREVLKEHTTGLDMVLWRLCMNAMPCLLFSAESLCVGIKGLPGRPGIGIGHRESFGTPMDLRDWIGDAAGVYGS